MRLPAVLTLAVVMSSSASYSQSGRTAAQKALEAEPEFQQINGINRDYHDKNALPNNDPSKPGALHTAVQGTVNLRTERALLDKLEARLESQARECNYCASKQEELSELIRQRMELQSMASGAFAASGTDSQSAQFLGKMMGVTPDETRWQNKNLALQEAENAISGHCDRLAAAGSAPANCRNATGGGAFKLEGAHENAWRDCFEKNNWVKTPSARGAYESCMDASDPLTKLCNGEKKGNRNPDYCPRFTVTASDVNALEFYNDRWITDPNRLTAMVALLPQAMNITLLDAVVVPKLPPSAPSSGGLRLTGNVRGRLENPLQGGVTGAAGRVVVVRPGAEVAINVAIDIGPQRDRAVLNLQIISSTASGEKPHQLISGSVYRQLSGMPVVGTVLIPSGSPLSFQVQCNCLFPMTQAEFTKRSTADAANASSAAPSSAYVSRPILAGSRIQTILLEPIDVPGIQADKRFHAQLNVESELPRGLTDSNGLKLPRGTDAYLKVVDQNASAQFGGHTAQLSLDYLVINGQKLTVQTDSWPHTFVVQPNRPVNPRRPARPEDSVLWPIGDTKWFDVTGQTEVPRSELVANSQSPAENPIVAIGNTRNAEETPHDSATTNTHKLGTAKRSAASPVVVTQPEASSAPSPPAAEQQTPPKVTSTAQAGTVTDLLGGSYEGTYNCAAQGSTGLRLDVTMAGNGSLTAIFHAAIANLPAYDLSGNYDPATKQFFLTPVRWESRPPAGYTMVGLQGVFDAAAGSLWGKVTDPRCGPFVVKRKQ